MKDLKKKKNPHSRQSKFPRKNHYVKYYVFPQTLKFKKNQKKKENEVLADEKVNKEQVDNHDLCDKIERHRKKTKKGLIFTKTSYLYCTNIITVFSRTQINNLENQPKQPSYSSTFS